MEMQNAIRDRFEQGFLQTPLDSLIAQCDDDNELTTLFREYLPGHQPILEAGCGSGRWVGWFVRNGWQAAGLDWSEHLCSRAQAAVPTARFMPGDMRNMPFQDGEFGAVVALGAVEHAPEGPLPALREFARVLRDDGIAIVTVPYGGPLRRTLDFLTGWLRLRIKARRTGAQNGRSLSEVAEGTVRSWYPVFGHGPEGYFFFEYHFSDKDMQQFFQQAGFTIIKKIIQCKDLGILYGFGPLAGRFNPDRGRVDFTLFGSFLRRVLPLGVAGHMLAYVVRPVRRSHDKNRPSADM